MVLLSSPLQLLFLVTYLVFIFFQLSLTSDFLSFWLFMEFSSLALFCSILSSSRFYNFSSVLVHFIIQSLSSIGLLLCYLCSFYLTTHSGLFLCLLAINIGLFPFNFLYFHSLINIPRLSLFLLLTLNNIPSCVLFNFYLSVALPIPSYLSPSVTLLLLLSTFLSILSIYSANTLLTLLLISSIFNGTWLVLFYLADPFLFILYFTIYSILSYFILFNINPHPSLFFTLMGLPPLPLFFINLLGLYILFNSSLLSFSSLLILLSLLSFSAVLSILYFNFLSSRFNLILNSSLYL